MSRIEVEYLSSLVVGSSRVETQLLPGARVSIRIEIVLGPTLVSLKGSLSAVPYLKVRLRSIMN